MDLALCRKTKPNQTFSDNSLTYTAVKLTTPPTFIWMIVL